MARTPRVRKAPYVNNKSKTSCAISVGKSNAPNVFGAGVSDFIMAASAGEISWRVRWRAAAFQKRRREGSARRCSIGESAEDSRVTDLAGDEKEDARAGRGWTVSMARRICGQRSRSAS